MTCHLQTIVPALFLSVYALKLQAQSTPVAGRLVGVNQDQQSCLTSAQHAEIQQMLRTKLALLNRNNPAARTTATHPTLSFPLRWVKAHAPYGFWTATNYVDLNPASGPNDVNQYTPSNLDYNCGNRTYDQKSGYQHQGTDLALWPFDWSVMAGEYVSVVAAAPGTLVFKRDGNDDQSCGATASNDNVDWNAVYIRHDDGSVTGYGNLKKQSLTTKNVGQRVEEGEFLGFVGSSGRSSGPHVHFEVYNAAGKLIDPYQGECNTTITDAWWKNQPLYKDKTINRLSVHLVQPVMNKCPASDNATNEIMIARPGQPFYFYTFGRELEIGDSIRLDVVQPDKQLFATYKDKGTANYSLFYWYMYTTIPATAPTGEWIFRTTYNGKVYEKPFVVATDLQSVVRLSSSVVAPVCAGDSVTLTASLDTEPYIWKRNGVVLDRLTDRKIVVRESGNYTAEMSGAVSNAISVTVVSPIPPTATLAASQTIGAATLAKLSVDFTGGGPWLFEYRDSTATGWGNPETVLANTNPYLFEIKLLKTTAYRLTGVSNVCGPGSLINRQILVTVLPPLGVDDPTLADAVAVYPVPTTGTLTVHIKGLPGSQLASLELIDPTGRIVLRQETRQVTSSLLLNHQPSGSYVLRIRVGERTASKRIVKL